MLLGLQLAQTLKEEHGDGIIVFVDDGAEQNMPEEERNKFEEFLPIKDKQVISQLVAKL